MKRIVSIIIIAVAFLIIVGGIIGLPADVQVPVTSITPITGENHSIEIAPLPPEMIEKCTSMTAYMNYLGNKAALGMASADEYKTYIHYLQQVTDECRRQIKTVEDE